MTGRVQWYDDDRTILPHIYEDDVTLDITIVSSKNRFVS